MKKERILVLLCTALAMCFFTSCSKDETATNSVEDVEAVTEIPFEVDGYATSRGLIVEEGDEIEVWWMTKESIGVYGSSLINAKFTGTNKYKNAATTTFSGGSLFKTPKYAYYPYSAENSSNAQTAVRGTLPKSQSWHTSNKVMTADYKIGTYKSRTWTGYNFTFTPVITFVKHKINATGTVLQGEKLQRVTMTVKTADGQPRQINGGFSMDLTQSADNALTWDAAGEESNVLALTWTNTPTMTADNTVTGYAAAAPLVQQGDVIDFVILTENYTATFSRTSDVNYTANMLVNYSMPLAEMEDVVYTSLKGEEPETPETPEAVELKINSFKFTVANNPGKILPRSFSHNSSFTVSTSTVEEVVCEVDNEARTIKAYIPYLNDRKLIPTFDIPEGLALGSMSTQATSGQTVIDFSIEKQILVANLNTGDVIFYDVELTNTGLPVVVVNQLSGTTSTESNSKYTNASNAWYAATGTKWQPKNSDWSMEDGDSFMVYNADGTSALTNKDGAVVNEPVKASTRLRGNVTQQMPKKPFAVKLDKKHSVLDMPAHKRWVLLANWKDRTLMRNAVANGIAEVFKQTFPNDGMAWNPSGQFVELVYNGVHVGTYYLCEQIKIDGNRLDINDPYDPEDGYSGNAADYGYLLESDDGYDETWQFTTACYVPFLFKDDGNDDMLSYASTFVRGIEDNLYKNTTAGYNAAFEKMDLTSFVDFWLIQELMMNSETGHPKSCYSYINNGKMYAGPIWDFDWNTLPTSTSYSENGYSYTESMLEDAMPTSGWFGSKSYQCYHKSSGYPSEPLNESDANYLWYPMLVKSAEFKALAAERWNTVKGAIQNYVNNEIPKIQAQIATSEALNNQMWPVDSGSSSWNSKRYSTYGIGGGFCGDEGKSFSDAVSTMQATLKTRINGMSYVSNQNWPNVTYGSK